MHGKVMNTQSAQSRQLKRKHWNDRKGGRDVTAFGFGCYRVSIDNAEHKHALKHALSSGINLIDTSTNYGDGRSEELVGLVLGEMLGRGELQREDVHVVTKVGYIQGRNLERVRENGRYANIVNYADHLWHCIEPDFIRDQLTESLERLKLSYVDTLLLHNPEYYLMKAAADGVDVEKARGEFYTRIEAAFEQLEREKAAGRIRSYGISSNTFPGDADSADFCSLERVFNIAESLNDEHGFNCVQLPFNLIEHAAATRKNQLNTTATVLDFAREKQLNVLVNRPLNAITQSRLIRLAAAQDIREISESEIRAALKRLVILEERFRTELLPDLQLADEDKTTLHEWLSPSAGLHNSLDAFDGREHWQGARQRHFEPRIKHAMDFLARLKSPTIDAWAGSFIAGSSRLFNMIDDFYAARSQRRAQDLLNVYAPIFAPDSLSLSHLALNALRAHPAVTCVLVGMRSDAYVDDCLAALQLDATEDGNEENWRAAAEVDLP